MVAEGLHPYFLGTLQMTLGSGTQAFLEGVGQNKNSRINVGHSFSVITAVLECGVS